MMGIQEQKQKQNPWVPHPNIVNLIWGGGSLAFMGLIWAMACKLYQSDIAVDFNDLLSLILALFAIGLSTTIYRSQVSSSDRFYTNFSHFTKDVSVVLGKIETGFGERLAHVDASMTDMSGQVRALQERRISIEAEKQEAQQSIEFSKESIKKLFSGILESSNLSDAQKEDYRQQIKDREEEIEAARSKLEASIARIHELEETLSEHQYFNNSTFQEDIRQHPLNIELRRHNLMYCIISICDIQFDDIKDKDIDEIGIMISERMENFQFIFNLAIDYGFFDTRGNFTSSGLNLLYAIIYNKMGNPDY